MKRKIGHKDMIFDFMAGAPSKCNWKVSHILYDAALILIHFPIHDVTIGAWSMVKTVDKIFHFQPEFC